MKSVGRRTVLMLVLCLLSFEDVENGFVSARTLAQVITSSSSASISISGGAAASSAVNSGFPFCEYRCLIGVSCNGDSLKCNDIRIVSGSEYCLFYEVCPTGSRVFSIIYIPFSPVAQIRGSGSADATSSAADPQGGGTAVAKNSVVVASASSNTDGAGVAIAQSSARDICSSRIPMAPTPQINSTSQGTRQEVGIIEPTVVSGSTTISGAEIDVPVNATEQVQLYECRDVNMPRAVVNFLSSPPSPAPEAGDTGDQQGEQGEDEQMEQEEQGESDP